MPFSLLRINQAQDAVNDIKGRLDLDHGILSEAMFNFLALLGWSSPNEGQEIMSLEEITRYFDLTRVQKNPAIFDNAKLNWMNRTYINKAASEFLADKAKGFFVEAGLVPAKPDAATLAWLAAQSEAAWAI